MDNNAFLTLIVFLPAVGAIAIALGSSKAQTIKLTAVLFTLATFALTIALFCLYDRSPGAPQFQFGMPLDWIPSIGASYFLGVDGLSLTMVLLTGLLGIIGVLVSLNIQLRLKEYFIWLLVLETGIMGVFISLDLLLFFLFWEVELIPMYMLISIWGSGRKEYSAIKFVLYTLAGSALMLAGILTIYFTAGTFDITMIGQKLGLVAEPIIPLSAMFFLLLFGFAVKLPVFPFHTWLPDAHTDAPTAVSVILAGVLLKMGGYGIIRLCVGFFPEAARSYAPYIAAFAVVSVLYGAAVTLRQTDLKRLIAYSSISHMGYVLLGIFALRQLSLTGATLQMFSHGIITGLLFAMVGLVYDHTHQRQIPLLGGLVRQMPVIAIVFSIAGLAALGLPSTSGFAAEFMVFMGSMSSDMSIMRIYTILGILAIVVTAGYILWMLERVFYREPRGEYDGVRDASPLEMVPIFSFVIAIMVVGIYPRILTDVIGPMFLGWG